MNAIWDEIRCSRSLTPARREALIEHYGERGRKALKVVEERRVKKYCDFFVVVGYNDEYVVDEEFCTCSDFLFRGRECVHLLAVRVACATDCYERYDSWYYPSLRR
ncbi:MAG: SWIM zinc finger family protein [Methanomicrobiales archaeon]|nr:SWIM zinc finger family protein [Methanomicrobiales archaeon]